MKRIALVGTVAAALVAGVALDVVAGGETRTISIYHIHTRESLTVTYMKNGRYIPSAMAQINYVMRDWRKGKVVRIDPKTIDLMWEIHADLGSNAPIHVICGYRSAGTNAFLKRIGRNVARHSQHINGKAIDFYFPDVPTQKVRDSALVREVGGVGYYRTAGGPTGFVHLDSGSVRYWGPRISATQMASIWRNAVKTVGRRMTGSDSALVATATVKTPPAKQTGLIAWFNGKKKSSSPADKPIAVASAPNILYGGDDSNELADLAADASISARKAASPPLNNGDMAVLAASASESTDETDAQIRVGTPIPKPRLKPIEVMMMAAAKMTIEPASAPPPGVLNHSVRTQVALLDANAKPFKKSREKAAEKSDLAINLPEDSNGLPLIRPVVAAAVVEDVNWWPLLQPAAQQPQPQVAQTQVVVRDGKGGIDPALLMSVTE